MLQNRRAREHFGRFFSQWFGYEQSLVRATVIPEDVRTKLRAESDALIERVVFDRKGPWTDIFRATESFIDADIARYYGDVSVPPEGPATWVSYGPNSERRGIIGHGAFLNAGTKFTDTSPTQRGIMVRTKLLCSPPKSIPPDLQVNLDQPPPSGSKCKLPGYKILLTQPSCAGCHAGMDPIGYGLERYDIGGKFRTTEPAGLTCPIDGKGTFLSPDGSSAPFSGPAELSDALVATGALDHCLSTRIFEYTQGRSKTGSDEESIRQTEKLVSGRSGSLLDVISAIVATPSFTLRTALPEKL